MLSWEKDPLLRDYVIKLLNALALYTPHKLKQHLHHVLPIMLKSLKSVCKKKQEFEYKPGEILHFLETCGSTLNDHLDLLIPGFIGIFEQMDGLQRIRIQVSLGAHSSVDSCFVFRSSNLSQSLQNLCKWKIKHPLSASHCSVCFPTNRRLMQMWYAQPAVVAPV